jgi:hypothetical protein
MQKGIFKLDKFYQLIIMVEDFKNIQLKILFDLFYILLLFNSSLIFILY